MRITGLLPRIYFVSLAQLLAIVAAVMIVSFLSFNPERGPEFERRGQYIVDTLGEHLGDPARLAEELERARVQMRFAISLYEADGRLIATNVEPPIVEVRRSRPHPLVMLFRLPHGPPKVRAGIASRPGAYAVFSPPPPPVPRDPGLWTLGIVLVATAVASILLARSFARPLAQLSAAARRFGTGDFTTRAGLKRRDEFGELSRAFDEMAEKVTELLRSRQQLLANVSHELRTPLARIRVALDLAADGEWQAELSRELLQEIAEDCAELERLVSDVFQTARLELTQQRATQAGLEQTLHMEPFDSGQLVQRAVERFRNDHPERSLELALSEPLPTLYGDQVLLRRVLSNLLDNAHKYSPEQTAVRLRARSDGEQLALSIEDQGIGIAAEDLPQVGTPFFRTDRSRTRRTGGVGLGVSLARQIVVAHAGSLSIESEVDHGTRVHVRLPIRSTAS
ncbi:MAG: HAMP domain-containing sensor histidine kinase [Polyangiales bacterium]